jgi:hypothetical protein
VTARAGGRAQIYGRSRFRVTTLTSSNTIGQGLGTSAWGVLWVLAALKIVGVYRAKVQDHAPHCVGDYGDLSQVVVVIIWLTGRDIGFTQYEKPVKTHTGYTLT